MLIVTSAAAMSRRYYCAAVHLDQSRLAPRNSSAQQVRLVPARSPDGNPEQDESNYKAAGIWSSRLGAFGNESVPNRQWQSNVTVVANTSYNRGGLFPSYQVGVHGPADNFDPPVSFWASPAGLKAGGGSVYAIPSAVVTPPG